jgi:hypothetical protein
MKFASVLTTLLLAIILLAAMPWLVEARSLVMLGSIDAETTCFQDADFYFREKSGDCCGSGALASSFPQAHVDVIFLASDELWEFQKGVDPGGLPEPP